MPPRLRVMLADDHTAVRQGVRALLQADSGVDIVDEAADTEGTMRRVGEVSPDVLVLDLSMPPAGGMALLAPLSTAHPATAVVVLTRHRDVALVSEALRAGAIAYVLKQSPIDELRRAITAAFERRPYIDAALRAAFDTPRGDAGGHVSNRERDVLRRSVLGQSNKEIGVALRIAVRTVEVHKARGMRKLQLPDRSALVRYAVVQGWLLEA